MRGRCHCAGARRLDGESWRDGVVGCDDRALGKTCRFGDGRVRGKGLKMPSGFGVGVWERGV